MSKDDIYTQLGKQIAGLLAKQWAGQIVYFPKEIEQKLSARDLELYSRFNGLNHAELAREYAVSLQHVYRIIKEVQRTQPQIDICEALLASGTRSNGKRCVSSYQALAMLRANLACGTEFSVTLKTPAILAGIDQPAAQQAAQ